MRPILKLEIFAAIIAILMILCPIVHADISTGLIGWWQLDEGAGTTTIDSSGNGNTGTLTNSPSWISGKVGAFGINLLSSSSQYIDFGTNSNMKPSLPVSIGVFFKMTDIANDYQFFDNDNDSTNTNYSGVTIYIKGSTGALGVQFGNNSGGVSPGNRESFQTSSGVSAGSWHCMVGTATSSSIMAIYLDGTTPSGSISGSGGFLAYSSTRHAQAGNLGQNKSFNLNGSIDNLAIWNRALTSTDAAQWCAETSHGYKGMLR